ncbi:MAG TPA: 5'-methylthioadenosine/S-adenosylhomocysteine nucleosidase [Anaerolineales bacterium]|nr:5'-methylthioadenosine/S-adenosylhomocysteine nucleosidase [Anaerolineales bacterium]
MNVIVLISAIAEWNAVKESFPYLEITASPYGETTKMKLKGWDLTLYHSGWGKVSSAGMMQYVIDHDKPDLVVNLGTCGGFEGLVEQGDVILVERTFIYDIVELMGDLNIVEYYASNLDLSWLSDLLPYLVHRGLIASADSDLPPEKIPYLKSMGAIAGDWESAALAWVAAKNKTRLLILRGVSDLVNEHAGEAYDNLALFEERTKGIMRKLFEQLPEWLDKIKI